jgi:hypothetical protein
VATSLLRRLSLRTGSAGRAGAGATGMDEEPAMPDSWGLVYSSSFRFHILFT